MKNLGITFLALAFITPVTFVACAGGSDDSEPGGGGGVGGAGGSGAGTTTHTTTTSPTTTTTTPTTTNTTGTGTGCVLQCSSDAECQNSCPPVSSGANCCDKTIGMGICYIGTASTCPTGGTGGTGGTMSY